MTSGRLVLCRHGQTEFNATFRYQGHVDIPLNDLGRQQAEALRERLAEESIDVAYTSDLARARDTAVIAMAKLEVPLLEDQRLREASFGRWEGL
ncbi:MAG: histidine phosphatase family protein, partial [Chloroflexota bacterium]|nr:histidine phosphatase family protein [Chloroflexota bacterium]